MGRTQRKRAESGLYHLLIRGINQQRVFEDDEDCGQFVRVLEQVREPSGFTLLAYCLMGNHVHLLVEEGAEPLGQSVKRLSVRYVMWFNSRYGRTGHLFLVVIIILNSKGILYTPPLVFLD